MAKLHFVVLIALVLLPLGAMAQAPDTVWIPNDFTVGTINSVIQGDTLSNGNPVNPEPRVHAPSRRLLCPERTACHEGGNTFASGR